MGFILIGFSDVLDLQGFLFGVFLIIYVIILMGNNLIIIISNVDPSLQNPMYYFLGNVSSLEICYVSVIDPRMLIDLCTQNRSISFLACATQMYFFLVLGATECFILTVMAYNRCYPLQPSTLPSHHEQQDVHPVGSWLLGDWNSSPHNFTYQNFSLPFCGSHRLNHFFCDIPPVLQLAYGVTFMAEMLIYVVAVLVVTTPFMLTFGSYVKIFSTVLKLWSVTGRGKTFSTFLSHLMIVALFFGSGVISYLRPKSNHSTGVDKYLCLFYTIVTSVFNPMINCLRNKDVMVALRKFLLKWIVL